MVPPLFLFAEDGLCADLGEAIVRHVHPGVSTVRRVTGGFGKVKTDLPKYASLATRNRVLVIVDLDRHSCPIALLKEWRLDAHEKPGLAFRIAVRECESWLMADAEGSADYFGVSVNALPSNPDSLPDPKEHLLNLLRKKSRGRREILQDMLPGKGAKSKVGLGYGSRLHEFVHCSWSPSRAADRSESLNRTVRRVRTLLSQG